MSIDDFEREGWEIIDNFGSTSVIMAKEGQRMVVDHDGEIIIKY